MLFWNAGLMMIWRLRNFEKIDKGVGLPALFYFSSKNGAFERK
jgi:hypothetical protein